MILLNSPKLNLKGFSFQLTNFNYIRIYRWNPYLQIKPYFSVFPVRSSFNNLMFLELLINIKNYNDPTLTFRRSCREGICGSCAMNINGKNTLACLEKIKLKTLTFLTIYPLPHFQIIKDLVPDLSHFYRQYAFIKPWLITTSKKPKENLQSVLDRVELNGLYECILCACCSASCPSYWWNANKYLGPSVLLQAYRWVSDSRDSETKKRLQFLNHKMRLFSCHNILNCSSVCPKGLKPSAAINKLKLETKLNYGEKN